MPQHLSGSRILDGNLRAFATPPHTVDKEHAGQFWAGNKKIKKNADRCGVFARMRQSEYTFILWDVVVFGFGLGLAFFFARYLHGPLIGVIPSV